jgi:ribosome biogenesis protein BMS1
MEALDFSKGEKKHKVSHSGAKHDKKVATKKKKLGQSTERHNPRAFSVANIVRTKKLQQRNLDRAQKKEVVPLINRAQEEPPPALVVVMGPAGVGKSTLIRSLVKMYTGQNVTDTKGPITSVAGKKRRVTFFECPLDIYSMTDLAKVADLVLLMVDSSYGFEMETFEFLNQLQLHGFPKVMGVMTHLDNFKSNKTLQNTKKALKNRFWTEIYKGAKMFDFGGVVNGKYLKHEVKRLSMYISRVKFRPLVWRNTHPYVMVDRIEDITSQSNLSVNSQCDRDITLFGYVRGTHLKLGMKMHLIGAGDFDIQSMSALEDPCPLSGTQKEKTSLKMKDSLLYAPMANVGGVQVMDRDGLYINLKNINYTKKENLFMANKDVGDNNIRDPNDSSDPQTPADFLRSMQDLPQGIDELTNRSEMSLFRESKSIESSQVIVDNNDSDEDDYSDDDEDDLEDEDDDDDGDDDHYDEEGEDYEGVENDEEEDDGDDDEEDDDDDNSDYEGYDDHVMVKKSSKQDNRDHDNRDDGSSSFQWKDNMQNKAVSSFTSRVNQGNDIMSTIYGNNWSNANPNGDDIDAYDDEEDDSEDFLVLKSGSNKKEKIYKEDNALDSNLGCRKYIDIVTKQADSYIEKKENNENVREMFENIKLKFVTGGWGKTNDEGGEGDEGGSDDEYGDFEDLQTGDKFNSSGMNINNINDNCDDDSDNDSISSDQIEMENEKIDEQMRKSNAEKKIKSKAKFDSEYDAEGDSTGKGEDAEALKSLELAAKMQEEQIERNKQEFGEDGELNRIRHEGFRQGLYVRIVISGVPAEFSENFQSHVPTILGGLLPHETALGYVKVRVKKHRWHKKILKSNDPLIFSVGWRRFQSMPVFTMEDQNEREKFLKYTPEHMHCSCTFYGPIVPPNTGVLAFQKASNTTRGFRISLTGATLELKSTPSVLKKLKLVGTPVKVFKNTAFITGMFNSALEVAKFEGAKLKTVSGIRGQIKKSLKDGEPGKFRATFEDKILMSDMIICRLWVNVEPKQYYNPVLSLLSEWKGMRTVGEIRHDNSIPQVVNADSVYKPIVRVDREFKKLNIPRKLQENLPFSSKPKQQARKRENTYMSRRAVVVNEEDKKKRALVQTLSTIQVDKKEKRHISNKARSTANAKSKAATSEKFAEVNKEDKKRKYREEGKEKMIRASKASRS